MGCGGSAQRVGQTALVELTSETADGAPEAVDAIALKKLKSIDCDGGSDAGSKESRPSTSSTIAGSEEQSSSIGKETGSAAADGAEEKKPVLRRTLTKRTPEGLAAAEKPAEDAPTLLPPGAVAVPASEGIEEENNTSPCKRSRAGSKSGMFSGSAASEESKPVLMRTVTNLSPNGIIVEKPAEKAAAAASPPPPLPGVVVQKAPAAVLAEEPPQQPNASATALLQKIAAAEEEAQAQEQREQAAEALRLRLRRDAEIFAKEQERSEQLRAKIRRDATAFVKEQERAEQLRDRIRRDATAFFMTPPDVAPSAPPACSANYDVNALRAKLRTAAELFYSQAVNQESYPAVAAAPADESYLAAQVELLGAEVASNLVAAGAIQKRAWRKKREELQAKLQSCSATVRSEVKEALLQRLASLEAQLDGTTMDF